MIRRLRKARGVTLVETMVSLSVLALGLTGLTQLQLISVRSNAFARKSAIAAALATDLVENVALWPYTDGRLATSTSVTSVTDSQIAARTELGREEKITDSSKKAMFAEQDTTNALTGNALRGAATYDGYSSDVDGDGVADFERYWSVFKIDPTLSGLEQGKLVVVTVRWKEAPIGYRQISMSTFRSNSGGFAQ